MTFSEASLLKNFTKSLEKIDGYKNKAENSSATKVSQHILLGFSMSTISSFTSIENKHDTYRGKTCMKTSCVLSREHAMKIFNFKKKKNEVLNKRAARII